MSDDELPPEAGDDTPEGGEGPDSAPDESVSAESLTDEYEADEAFRARLAPGEDHWHTPPFQPLGAPGEDHWLSLPFERWPPRLLFDERRRRYSDETEEDAAHEVARAAWNELAALTAGGPLGYLALREMERGLIEWRDRARSQLDTVGDELARLRARAGALARLIDSRPFGFDADSPMERPGLGDRRLIDLPGDMDLDADDLEALRVARQGTRVCTSPSGRMQVRPSMTMHRLRGDEARRGDGQLAVARAGARV